MKNAQLTQENAKEMLDSGIPSLVQLALSTYPELRDYTQIKTWDDVLTAFSLQDKDEYNHPAVKIELIFEAIRGSKQVVFDGLTWYYTCWRDMVDNRFVLSDYYCFSSCSCVSSRNFVQDEERINHIVKYFEQELKEYFIR